MDLQAPGAGSPVCPTTLPAFRRSGPEEFTQAQKELLEAGRHHSFCKWIWRVQLQLLIMILLRTGSIGNEMILGMFCLLLVPQTRVSSGC